MRSRQLLVDEIQVELVRKNVKYINLRILNDVKVRVSAPALVSQRDVLEFVSAKSEWIRKHQKKFRDYRYQIKQREKILTSYYCDDKIHYFQAQPYRLQIIESATQMVIPKASCLQLFISKDSTQKQRRELLESWYRAELKRKIAILIAKYEPWMGVKVKEFGVKKMKTRWGSCNPGAKRIWLNLELAQKKPIFLEYVVVHEMVHLLEASHNNRFQYLMDKFMPNWRQHKEQLNLSVNLYVV